MSEAVLTPETPIPDPHTVPLAAIDMSDARIFQRNLHEAFFARMRKEDPVHYCADSPFGPMAGLVYDS